MEVPFTVTKWSESPVDAGKQDFPLNIAHVEYELDGELKGKAYIEYLLYYIESNPDNPHLSTSKITGFLYFEGTYMGKRGSFTASEQGTFDKGNLDSPGTIIKGTGELESLKGSYQYQFIGQASKLILNFTF